MKWHRRAPQAFKRLSTRFAGVSLGLSVLVQAACFGVVDSGIERNARVELARQLEVGERIWQRLLDQKAQSLVQGATLLASDFGFRAALSSGDEGTLSSALQNNAARIGADTSAWVDTALQVHLADAPGGGTEGRTEGSAALQQIAGALVRSERGTAVGLVAGKPFQFVAVPVKAPLVIGWVVMGFPINQALVDDMGALSGMDVALLSSDAGAVPKVDFSTLGAAAAHALSVPAAVSDDTLSVDGSAMLTRRIPLAAGSTLLLLQSVDEALAPFRRLQGLLLAISIAGVAVFAGGSVVAAGRITTPLRSLLRASERLGGGNYDQPLQHTGRSDEIGDLAKAFDRMRLNIAAQAAEVRRLAYWDQLTGLPNRAQFRDALQAAIAGNAHTGGVLSVVMLDLNRFKHVNDVLGYAFGDRLLQAVAERISGQMVRSGDMVARLSGDEFALLLPGSDAAQALAVAGRIADVFELPLLLEDQSVDVSAGFGVASWPAHAGDASALISRAEVAMYTAKRKTTSAMVYDPSIDSGSALTLSLLSELRRALEHSELRLFLQPKIALHSGEMTGAEALVRWQHPTRGLVPPMQFISFAEQTGFVRQLTLWMFEATARQWPMMQSLGIRRVSVNLSTRDLMDAELPAKLDRILQQQHVSAEQFCLEITESAIMDEPLRAEATLIALSAAGFRLSIDDFGTGYSSLAYLKRLPVNELKIDKSFVMAMEHDADDAKIVRSTIDLAHNLGLSVVAEGVENAAVWNQLRALDCDEAQGFHMSRPVPTSELPAFAARWNSRQSETASAALH